MRPSPSRYAVARCWRLWRRHLRRAGVALRQHRPSQSIVYDEHGQVLAYSVTQAAKILGVNRKNLYAHMHQSPDGWRLFRRPLGRISDTADEEP